MNSNRKSTRRDRNMRHAFIYINVLRTDMGLTFKEITKYLNDDIYRTRDGLPYTEKQVLEIWNERKGKYKMEYFNYQQHKPSPLEVKAKHVILKVTQLSEKPKHELLREPPYQLLENAYILGLKEAADELSSKLGLNPPIDTNIVVSKLVSTLINVIITYNIHPKKLTNKTLNFLGGLIYHPEFQKLK